LARALLVDGNVDEADEMATASEQLAGQNLKTAIGWRVARAEVLAERGDVAGAVAIAEQAVDIAAGTDLVIDHADACAALTALRARAGDAAGARAARADARRLYEQKGATVPAERLAENEAPAATTHPVPSLPRSVRDDNEERHDHPRAENRASRVLARYEQLVSERRYDEAAALYADDLVATDRRSGVSVPPLGPVELQQGVRLTFDLFDGFDSVNVAVRGERLVLSKLALRTHDGLEVPFLQLFEIDDSDRIRATTHFDPDALADAIDELDERYLAGEGAEHADAIRPMLEHLAAFHARDWEALAQSVRDYEIVDHRGLWPDTGPEAYVERMQSLAATAPDVTIVARQLHLRGDAGLITAVVRATAAQGDRYEYTFHTVSRPGRMEYFDEEDFAAALARFDELSRTDPSPPRVENAASRIWAQVIAAVNSGASLDDLAELYAPFHLDDRRPVVNFGERDSAGVGRALDVFREQGYEFEVPTALAVRGERLALCASRSRTSGGYESAQLDVVEVDEQGRLLDCVQFGEADLDAAIDELDTRYLAGEGAEHSDVVRAAGRVQHAFNEEPDALDALCSPDFMLDDHRRLMYGEGDRDYFVSIRRASSDAHVRATATINRSIFVQGRALLAVQDLHRDDADGADYRWGYSVLVAFDALWRLQRLEWFDDDHWDAALARFDELAAEVPEPAAAKPDSYALLTRAVRCAHAYDEAFAAQDWDRIEASYHDDVVNEDRRNAVSSGVTTGRDGLLELVRRLVDVGFTTVTQTPVAVRGEALALVHRTWETASGYCLELLAVIEYDEEDRMTANVMFDLDGHGAALQGLDDRYCAGEGAADAYLIRRAGDFVRSLASPDGAATLALVHPDVRFTDHRRLGLGTLGFDGVRGILAARAEQIAADTSYFRDLAVRDSTTMGLLVSAGTGPDGTEVLYELYWVSRWVAGRTLDVDGYDPPDHDAARARFDQLAATDPRTPHIHNAALQVFARADWLLGHGEAAAGYALMADDVVGTFRRRAVSSPPTSGREEFERVIRSMRETFPRATYEPVAVRGDRLALVRINMLTDAGFEVPHLGLYEIDEAELISRVVTFDDSDLVGALEELEQRHRELSGDTYTHAEQSFAERSIAYQRGDLDTMLTFLSQHYQVVDHTPVGFGTADAAGLRAQIAAWDPQVPTVVIQAKRYVSERAILEAIAHRGTTDDGSDYVWENATVACFDANGLVVADHSFPIEQWDEAVALFDELATLEP
ncbi:MAG: nuclear transport factor 2 family protein, partial [Acidimicrobiia bacterium]